MSWRSVNTFLNKLCLLKQIKENANIAMWIHTDWWLIWSHHLWAGMFGGRERIRPCCSRCGDTERERMWWMGVLCCSGTSRVDEGSCCLSLPRPSAAQFGKAANEQAHIPMHTHAHAQCGKLTKRRWKYIKWMWNIDELTALIIQLIYFHSLIDNSATFGSHFCSMHLQILLWDLWTCLCSKNVVIFLRMTMHMPVLTI